MLGTRDKDHIFIKKNYYTTDIHTCVPRPEKNVGLRTYEFRLGR